MNSSDQPWISVVTPVFNGEPYLSQCIEAVLNQTYRQFDYTIVNNCSTDRSLEIARQYAARDSRIRIVSNETFLSQIANLNHALTFISPSSRYCKLALADDLLFPNCLESMVNVAETDPEVAVVGAYETVGTKICCQGIPFGTSVVGGREACRLYLQDGRYLFGSQNSVLYHSEEVRRRRPFFRTDLDYFQDADTCFDILRDKKFGFVHQVLTFTRRDNVSQISAINSFGPFLFMEISFLHRFGKVYLSPSEFERRWRKKYREYLLFLGESLLRRPRDRAFWDYHAKGNHSLGR